MIEDRVSHWHPDHRRIIYNSDVYTLYHQSRLDIEMQDHDAPADRPGAPLGGEAHGKVYEELLHLAAIDDVRTRLQSQEENADSECMYAMPFSPSALASLRCLVSDNDALVPERLAWLDGAGTVTQMPDDTDGIVEGVGSSGHIFVTFVNRSLSAARRIKKGQLRCGDMGLSINKVWGGRAFQSCCGRRYTDQHTTSPQARA